MKPIIALHIALLATISAIAQPKVGLTLSGGGAKGLAHIGILKAIDSAGLKIDMVTGTSMGSIVGAMYAAGYSGNQIEQIAAAIEWKSLLSNSVSMRNYTMEEKSEYGKYAAELPFVKGKVAIPTGIIESQELWIKLQEIFFPVMQINNFDELPIPFRCVATNLQTGQATVFSKGNLVQSLRASMAIPGAFALVDIDGNSYVDGGVVRNFPVQDAIAMGAEYTIGVSVSHPLKNIAELDNPIKILNQIVFLGESTDREMESKLCNLLIDMPVSEFSTADFSLSKEIIEAGNNYGQIMYPIFKALADSLNNIYPNYAVQKTAIPEIKKIKIDSTIVIGLAPKETRIFLEQLNVQDSTDWFTSSIITEALRNAYSFRNYNRVTYEIINDSLTRKNQLLFSVKKEPKFVVKGGVNFNNFTGFSAVGNLTARNWFSPYARSILSLSLGDNFRSYLEHTQLVGRKSPWSLRASFYTEYQELNNYQSYKLVGVSQQKYHSLDVQMLSGTRRKWTGGFGAKWDYVRIKPRTLSGIYVDGKNTYFNAYGFTAINSFDRPIFPHSGLKLDFQLGFITDSDASFGVYKDADFLGNEITYNFSTNNYLQSVFSLQSAFPISSKWTFEPKVQSGINYGSNNNFFNNFYAGGVTKTFRNQITFIGFREGQESSESMLAISGAIRFEPVTEMFITGTFNTLFQDFSSAQTQLPSTDRWAAGAGLTLSYNMLLGPLEFTVMWNDKTGKLASYVNFGFAFK